MSAKLNRILSSWWFGEAFVLALCGSIVVAALLLTPSTEAVALFGWDVPMMCTFRQILGVPCLGCGMTRSFAFMAHGDLWNAFEMNVVGPLFFLMVASQVPYRTIRLVRRAKLRRQHAPAG